MPLAGCGAVQMCWLPQASTLFTMSCIHVLGVDARLTERSAGKLRRRSGAGGLYQTAKRALSQSEVRILSERGSAETGCQLWAELRTMQSDEGRHGGAPFICLRSERDWLEHGVTDRQVQSIVQN